MNHNTCSAASITLFQNSLRTSVGGGYKGFRASASFSMKNLNENINQNTRLGKSLITFTIGSRTVPLPIHIKLMPITKALDKIWWGGFSGWRRDKVNLKQRNLARAVKDYPRYVRAKINKGICFIMSIIYTCTVLFSNFVMSLTTK